jgi:hypothetical protein
MSKIGGRHSPPAGFDTGLGFRPGTVAAITVTDDPPKGFRD